VDAGPAPRWSRRWHLTEDIAVDGQVNTHQAVALIGGAIPRRAGTWADIGAGDGTFTRALVKLLGADSRVYAVDRDASAVAALERWAATDAPNVIPVTADFTRPFDLPGLDDAMLDGMLLANALHFVRDAEVVLARLAARVRPGGRVVIVEYDRRAASRWVPYPVPIARLPALADAAGLSTPTITATRPSLFGGTLYVAAGVTLSRE
jgi:ubiquinone/menaquinone biosynthesis C-methylase UbiE